VHASRQRMLSVMLGSASHPSTTAIEGRAGPGQRSILSEFNRLQYEGMTPQQSPMALLPEETCFLQIAQAIKNGSNTSGHGCAYRVSSDDEFSRCWFGTHPLVCGLYRPNATYDVASDPLLFRYRRTAPATIADSYLFRVLMETDRATNLHLVGDSTMEQLFKAAQCEVGRAFLAEIPRRHHCCKHSQNAFITTLPMGCTARPPTILSNR